MRKKGNHPLPPSKKNVDAWLVALMAYREPNGQQPVWEIRHVKEGGEILALIPDNVDGYQAGGVYAGRRPQQLGQDEGANRLEMKAPSVVFLWSREPDDRPVRRAVVCAKRHHYATARWRTGAKTSPVLAEVSRLVHLPKEQQLATVS